MKLLPKLLAATSIFAATAAIAGLPGPVRSMACQTYSPHLV